MSIYGDSGDDIITIDSRGDGDSSEDCLRVMVRGRGTGGACDNIFAMSCGVDLCNC